MKWKLNITKDTKVTILGLQESTFPFLQEEEYDFKAQQTSETIKYMHYVHGSTSSFHLSVLMLDTKKLLYLPLSPWKLLSPLCPVLYQQFSLTKSDKYTVNPNLCSVSEYCLIGKQCSRFMLLNTIWKISAYWTEYVYTNSFCLKTCTVEFFCDSLIWAPESAFAS